MRWKVRFNGRRIGSLGCFMEYQLIIEAKTTDEIMLKIYEDYEHCTNFRFDPV